MMPQLLRVELPRIDVEPSRILVVDDEADVRNLISFKLATAGYEVLTAANGAGALAAIERSTPDLVILDVSMPEMSGIEVCRHLRATLRTQALPVIMLTARAHVMHEHEGLMAGADLYLMKPFSPRVLLSQVQDLLSYTRD